MNPCLIPDLDLRGQIGGRFGHATDHLVLGLPGDVRIIKIEDVVVLHPPFRDAPTTPIPHTLEETSGGQVALPQVECTKAEQQFGVDRVLPHAVQELGFDHAQWITPAGRSLISITVAHSGSD